MLHAPKILENGFNNMHGEGLSSGNNLFKNLAEKTKDKIPKKNTSIIPLEVLLCLSKTRTYIRLRDINRMISFGNCKGKLN